MATYNIGEIERLISSGKYYSNIRPPIPPKQQENIEAWKIKCIHLLKRYSKDGLLSDLNVNKLTSPEVIVAHLDNILSEIKELKTKEVERAGSKEQDAGKVLLCFHCGNKTHMQAVATHKNKWKGVPPGASEEVTWSLYFCPVCSKVTLEESEVCRGSNIFSETSQSDRTLYPPITSDSDMPENVRNSFEAALKVKNIDGAICLISLRRTLEMMCKDKGATQANLFKQLKYLAGAGILPPIIDKMAEVLKNLGNMAAHADNQEFSAELVSSMIEFTETILEYVYVLPAKLAAIQGQFNRNSSNEDTEITRTASSS